MVSRRYHGAPVGQRLNWRISTFPTDLGGAGSRGSASEAQKLQAERSSNGSSEVSSHQMDPAGVVALSSSSELRARQMAPAGVGGHSSSSTLVSHQMSQGSSAQTQTPTRGPLRLRCRLLFTAAARHDLSMDAQRRKGRREASSACSSSASSAQWLTGASVAPPSHPGTPHFRR